MRDKKVKVVHMVTVANSVGLMKGQLSFLNKHGYDINVVSSQGEKLNRLEEEEKINTKAINMERGISPFKDLISLIQIVIHFMKIKPEICNAGTPKAGLLGMLAAKITRVPFKVYTIRGFPYEGTTGLKRKILVLMEKIASFCADKVICISPSLKKEAIRNNIVAEDKAIVFGAGSSNGLQLYKYLYNEEVEEAVNEIKSKYKLQDYEFIIGYVGRINNSKGIVELVNAFKRIQEKYKNIALLMVGPIEEKDSIPYETQTRIQNDLHIKSVGHVDSPVPYYYLMDILAFPTYREGFGNVSIEAQATGTPVITTNATGAIDTVIDLETGFIIPKKDEKALEEKIEEFIKHPHLIEKMGQNANKRVHKEFSSDRIWNDLKKLYDEETKI